jgi:type IV pilus assembly protein PilW
MRRRQAGVTLLELLVGLAIGLMTIAVALGALLVSRGVSGTVSDASQLQQQAAYALRVIGLQLRQAGSIRLNLAFTRAAGTASEPLVISPTDKVAFENVFNRQSGTLNTSSEYVLRIGYQNYTESVSTSATEQSLLADCLGKRSAGGVVQSDFKLVRASGAVSGELQCAGSDGVAQALIGNVADFQVRYLLQTQGAGGVSVRRATAADVGADWPSVVAVEVCLELVGDENIDSAGATYRNCSWTAGQSPSAMGNRLRMVFRNTFQLRSQGAPR